MEETPAQQKQDFYKLLQYHNLPMLDLAKASKRSPLVLWAMIFHGPVTREDAVQVLATFNELRGTQLTLENVDILLKEGEP